MSALQYGTKWTHDETVIALGLYFQIPFGRITSSHPRVVEIAEKMNRSPASLSMKMGNLGRLDPTLAAVGISGLVNGAKMEKVVWDEYADKREELSEEYDRLISSLGLNDELKQSDIPIPEGVDGARIQKYRVNQSFFRASVLSAYNFKCCITGISIPNLLVASHIKPWAKCENGHERTDTQNGLCLNALHDKAFDKGLITLDEDLRIVLSSMLKDIAPVEVMNEYFLRYEGHEITMPDRGAPAPVFLDYHRNNIFAA